MFDITNQSDARKILNQILLGMGFVQYQQSILVYPHPIKETVTHVCRLYKISRYISFVTAEDVDGSDRLRKHFGLT